MRHNEEDDAFPNHDALRGSLSPTFVLGADQDGDGMVSYDELLEMLAEMDAADVEGETWRLHTEIAKVGGSISSGFHHASCLLMLRVGLIYRLFCSTR